MVEVESTKCMPNHAHGYEIRSEVSVVGFFAKFGGGCTFHTLCTHTNPKSWASFLHSFYTLLSLPFCFTYYVLVTTNEYQICLQYLVQYQVGPYRPYVDPYQVRGDRATSCMMAYTGTL